MKLHLKIPTQFNDKNEIPTSLFKQTQNEFFEMFGGYTINPPAHGGWLYEGKPFFDKNISYEIYVEKKKFAIKTKLALDKLVKRLEKRFMQKKISCYYHDIMSTRV